MRYPKFLPEGGTIGFIAPSFGCNIEPYKSAFANALKKFQAMGYQTQLGPNVYEGSGIGISNTPQKCGQEIMDYYCSKENDILISCGGGELMCEDLNYVDFEALKAADPKWFMGYSDNTNLAFLLATLCDTAAVYGPCAPAFGMEPWHPALSDAFGILNGESATDKTAFAQNVQNDPALESASAQADASNRKPISFTIHGYDLYEAESKKDEEHPLEPYNVTEPCVRIGYPGQQLHAEGRLIGGCLDILVNLLGTKFDRVSEFIDRYQDDGILWFIEACDLNVLSIRRAIWQMEAAGWFRNAKGILVGRPYHHKEEAFGLDQYHAVTDLLASYNIPIFMDLDIGHIPPMMPLILGSYAKADLSGNDFKIQMELR